jgi:pimeloyl-ACP methyl ester carboxylesterase
VLSDRTRAVRKLPAAPHDSRWARTDAGRPARGRFVRVREIEEPSPDLRDVPPGYFAPPPNFVVGNEWRLIPPLRAAAAGANPLATLASAAAAQVLQDLSPSPANLGAAFADLAVTGRNAYKAFVRSQPREAASGIESAATAMLVAMGTPGVTAAMVSKATTEVLDRAYQVAWFLRGETDRGELGWIAVSGEDDLPHRPVNVPRTPFPQHDLNFSVPGDLSEVGVRTRFAIATAADPPAPPALPASTRRVPPPLAEPTLPKGDQIILFINGSDSRLEEANDLIPKLVRLPDGRPSGYSVISFDLPGSGYASLIDHTEVGPWVTQTREVDIPVGALGPIVGGAFGLPVPPVPVSVSTGVEVGVAHATDSVLSFMEMFIIRFVQALSARLGGPDRALVESRLAAVVGGSLGGNLALRLARRGWVKNVVAWDAGSVWPSMWHGKSQDADAAEMWAGASIGIPEVGSMETDGSRDAFFAGVFDKKIPLKTQPDQWYGDHFWARSQDIEGARLDRRETYTSQFRRWHWRVSIEELMWSWQDPSVQNFNSRILLGAGTEDNIWPARFFKHTDQLAHQLASIEGDTFFFNHTGHSVHAERPQALANKIIRFVSKLLFAENANDGTVAFNLIRRDLQGTDAVWQGHWMPGWTNLQIFPMGGKDYLFGYKVGDGTVAFDELRSDLHNTKGLWKGGWTTGWTNTQIFSMGGKNYIFSYKVGDGTVAFDEIRDDLQSTNYVWKGTWNRDWTTTQIFSMDGKNFLLRYNWYTGDAAFDEIPNNLQDTIEVWRGKWTTAWTNFRFFSMNGKTCLFCYKPDGTADFDEIPSDLQNTIIRWQGQWPRNWTHFEPFSIDKKNFLLLYNTNNGRLAIDEIPRDLQNTIPIWQGSWVPGWTSLQIYPMT